MQPMLTGSNVDDFYAPDSYLTFTYSKNSTINMDHCLAHTNTNGQIHYHAASPCLGTPSIASSTPYTCYSLTSCWGTYLEYSLSYYTASSGLTPIGLAKDGHIIWGPYTADGEAFDACDLDYCSGSTIDGVYGYASTQYHPYLPACYGPATSRGSYQQQCTSNAPYCGSSSLLAQTKQANRPSTKYVLETKSMIYLQNYMCLHFLQEQQDGTEKRQPRLKSNPKAILYLELVRYVKIRPRVSFVRSCSSNKFLKIYLRPHSIKPIIPNMLFYKYSPFKSLLPYFQYSPYYYDLS